MLEAEKETLMLTSKTKIVRTATLFAAAFSFVTSTSATTLTIEAVGNGTLERLSGLGSS